jgi:DNA-directed RNA polymerase specialized sigma24 family protein
MLTNAPSASAENDRWLTAAQVQRPVDTEWKEPSPAIEARWLRDLREQLESEAGRAHFDEVCEALAAEHPRLVKQSARYLARATRGEAAEQDADDLVALATLQTARSVAEHPDWDVVATFNTIARRGAANALRDLKKLPTVSLDDDGAGTRRAPRETLEDPRPALAAEADDRQAWAEQIVELMMDPNVLTPGQREVLVAVAAADDMAQAAEALGKTYNAVKEQMSAARKRLRKKHPETFGSW